MFLSEEIKNKCNKQESGIKLKDDKKKDTKTLVPYKQDYTQYDDEQQQD